MDLIPYGSHAWAVKDKGRIKAGPFLEKWKAALCYDLLAMIKKGREPKAQKIEVVRR